MDIAALNEKIIIQKSAVEVDEVGNHIPGWEDYYECHATVSTPIAGGMNGSLNDDAGEALDVSEIAFTIRYCLRAASINVTDYRVIFRDEIYDILSVDYMNFKKKSLKVRCRKARR